MKNSRCSARTRRPALPSRLMAVFAIAVTAAIATTGCNATATATATASAAATEPTAAGDIPDTAVFLTYADAANGFSIQYVEGWQVAPDTSGVTIRDKDSSERVVVVSTGADASQYISQTDLPALQAQTGFSLVSHDTVQVGSTSYSHIVYHLPSEPDPVTGKQVPSTVDRYYVPGNGVLAVVSLSTPDGVDYVDAFRQMIQSFTWS